MPKNRHSTAELYSRHVKADLATHHIPQLPNPKPWNSKRKDELVEVVSYIVGDDTAIIKRIAADASLLKGTCPEGAQPIDGNELEASNLTDLPKRRLYHRVFLWLMEPTVRLLAKSAKKELPTWLRKGVDRRSG